MSIQTVPKKPTPEGQPSLFDPDEPEVPVIPANEYPELRALSELRDKPDLLDGLPEALRQELLRLLDELTAYKNDVASFRRARSRLEEKRNALDALRSTVLDSVAAIYGQDAAPYWLNRLLGQTGDAVRRALSPVGQMTRKVMGKISLRGAADVVADTESILDGKRLAAGEKHDD